jgi:hypothetical protein
MTGQNFRLRGIDLVLNRKRVLAVIAWVWLLSGCSLLRPTSPVLHKTNCDLNPVLAVRLPEHVGTLASIPRSKVIAENGINKNTGDPQPDGIKELFYLNKGDVEYEFDLCFSDTAARQLYESARDRHPVLHETGADGRNACLHYTEQPRSDPEGGSSPMNDYISRASFRLHNAFIRVTAQDDKAQSEKLTNAVKDLAQMLDGALNSTH